MARTSLPRHLVDVGVILVLGFLYLVFLSVGTALSVTRQKIISPIRNRDEPDERAYAGA